MHQENQPADLASRELIPRYRKVSWSQEIGEAVVTENIFGRAKVRIIRKGEGLRRALWWAAGLAALIAAFMVWQVWQTAHEAGVWEETGPLPAPENAATAPAAGTDGQSASSVVATPVPASGVPAAPVTTKPLIPTSTGSGMVEVRLRMVRRLAASAPVAAPVAEPAQAAASGVVIESGSAASAASAPADH